MADADVEKGVLQNDEGSRVDKTDENRNGTGSVGNIRRSDIGIQDQTQGESSEASSNHVAQSQEATDESILNQLVERFGQPSFWGVRSDPNEHVKVSGEGMKPTEQILGAMHLRNFHYLKRRVLRHHLIIHGVNDYTISDEARNLCSAMCGPERLDMVRDDLVHYCTALQNYKLWKEDCLDPIIPPATGFERHGGTLAIVECTEFQENGLLRTQRGIDWKTVVDGYIYPGPKMMRKTTTKIHSAHIESTGKAEKLGHFLSRLAMAMFGGLALIAPMFIMSLHQTRLTALLTTSMFVIAVGAILAWWMDEAKSQEIVAATAAYAAVLVVFVGVTLTPTT
ncbi:hypothetical protein L207DRAFT_576767 [Hyaloscypha variabilis F]|uniref:DUF6594 domain-containing protein n=1 Tax=Hyaloscypha variabilis (strain UAMH 11265 / GT02V1 / F) TaxID=1149755 RepID=A0A2J6S538_HYAVF|nr:hypothetical protein L207DRAFT_576767 [Hyaloscypha variabilis F]